MKYPEANISPHGTRALFVCLFGFLTSSSTTRLYRGRAPRQERLTILRAATHETELGDHVSAGHIIQTPTQPVGSGRPQRESNPGPPHQESRALPQSYRAPLAQELSTGKWRKLWLRARSGGNGQTTEGKYMEKSK